MSVILIDSNEVYSWGNIENGMLGRESSLTVVNVVDKNHEEKTAPMENSCFPCRVESPKVTI